MVAYVNKNTDFNMYLSLTISIQITDSHDTLSHKHQCFKLVVAKQMTNILNVFKYKGLHYKKSLE